MAASQNRFISTITSDLTDTAITCQQLCRYSLVYLAPNLFPPASHDQLIDDTFTSRSGKRYFGITLLFTRNDRISAVVLLAFPTRHTIRIEGNIQENIGSITTKTVHRGLMGSKKDRRMKVHLGIDGRLTFEAVGKFQFVVGNTGVDQLTFTIPAFKRAAP